MEFKTSEVSKTSEVCPAETQRESEPSDAPGARGSFLTHAAIYGLGSLALQAASVLLVPVYTRCLKPAEFGILEVLTRAGEILSICLLVHGVRMAGFTFYCQAPTESERKRTATAILITPMVLLVGCGLLAAAFSSFLGRLIGIEDSGIVAFAIVMIVAEGMTVAPLTLIQARVESGYFIAVAAMMFCCRLGLTILTVVVLQWGLWGVLMASTATSLIFTATLTWRELRRCALGLDLRKVREVLAFALPLVPAGLCSLVLHSGDRFFLMRFCGAEEVGLYALGYRLAMAAGMCSATPLLQVWTARVYDAFRRPDAAVFVGRVATRILGVYLFVGIGVCLFDEDLIGILAMPSYHSATALVGPLTLAYFLWFAASLMDAPIWVRRRTGLKPWIFLFSGSVSFGLYLRLIPPYGVWGAVWATVGGLLAHCAATYVVSQRLFRVQYEFGRLLAMFALAAVLVAGEHYTEPGAIGLAQKVALWMLWPAVLWLTGVVTQEENTFMLAACSRAWQRLLPYRYRGYRRGDRVVVRSLDEILATLDADGRLDGLPFMPEMVPFCGRAFRVHRRAERTCVEGVGMRGMDSAVLLEGLRCDGTAHEGCQRDCLLFWKEAWLKRLPKYSRLRKSAEPEAAGTSAGKAAAARRLPTVHGDRFVCQSTELAAATTGLRQSEFRSLVHDLFVGEVALAQVAFVAWVRLANKIAQHVTRKDFYRRPAGMGNRTGRAELNLQPGELVEVKTLAEIQATLDAEGQNRGLRFELEMTRWCGERFRVAAPLRSVIAEKTGRMIQLAGTVTLEGNSCGGLCSLNCPRANHFWWREIWLKRVEEPAPGGRPTTLPILTGLPCESGCYEQAPMI